MQKAGVHTKSPLQLATISKEGASGALGGEQRRGGEGHLHSCAGFEAKTTLGEKKN